MLPASSGRDNDAVHVERTILLAEDAALRQAVRIFATAIGRSASSTEELRPVGLAGSKSSKVTEARHQQ